MTAFAMRKSIQTALQYIHNQCCILIFANNKNNEIDFRFWEKLKLSNGFERKNSLSNHNNEKKN